MRIFNQMGFSTVELMVGLAIAAVGGFAIMEGLRLIKWQEKKLEDQSTRIMSSGNLATYFNKNFSSAGPSQYFFHLPIPVTGCQENGPCVRKLIKDPSGKEALAPLNSAGELGAGPTHDFVEFFRDADAEIVSTSINMGTGEPAILYEIENFQWESKPTEYFTTWPLTNESSPAFTMMVQDHNKIYLTADNACFSSSGAYAGRGVFFNASNPIEDLAAFKGKMLVIYASVNIKHFFLQAVDSIKSCKADPTFCTEMRTKIPCAASEPPPDFTQMYFVELVPLSGNTGFKTKTIPPLNYLTGGLRWPKENSDWYPFPTEGFSIYQEGSSDFNTLPADLKRIGHFYHTTKTANNTAFVAFPVAFKTFGLNKTMTKEKGDEITTYDLYEKSLSNIQDKSDHQNILLKGLKTKIFFIRKLGTDVLSLFVPNE